jgi:hypothetical protein
MRVVHSRLYPDLAGSFRYGSAALQSPMCSQNVAEIVEREQEVRMPRAENLSADFEAFAPLCFRAVKIATIDEGTGEIVETGGVGLAVGSDSAPIDLDRFLEQLAGFFETSLTLEGQGEVIADIGAVIGSVFAVDSKRLPQHGKRLIVLGFPIQALAQFCHEFRSFRGLRLAGLLLGCDRLPQ